MKRCFLVDVCSLRNMNKKAWCWFVLHTSTAVMLVRVCVCVFALLCAPEHPLPSTYPTKMSFQAALRSLAGRVLRAYVTHCALVRPLSEEGKAKVAQDMATLEIALSPLARVREPLHVGPARCVLIVVVHHRALKLVVSLRSKRACLDAVWKIALSLVSEL